MQQVERIEDEIDLLDVLRVLWKRKILILSLTIIVPLVAGLVTLMLPDVYEVTAIIEPGQDAAGKPVVLPEAIKENIQGGAYDQYLMEHFKLSADDMPEWRVRIPKKTSLVRIALESDRPQQAVQILNELLRSVTESIEKRLAEEKRKIENEIRLARIKHDSLQKSAELLRKQLAETAAKIRDLEAARRRAMAANPSNAMSVLLYSNEIQNQQIYLNNLQLRLENTEKDVKSSLVEIDNARLKLEKVRGTNVNKYPNVPEKPVKPKRLLIVVLALVLGGFAGVVVAFLAESLEKARGRQAEADETA